MNKTKTNWELSSFQRGRYIIFGVALALTFLYSLYRVGAPPVGGYVEVEDVDGLRDYSITENLRRYLNTRFNFDIDEGGIILAPRFGIPDGYGYSVLAWFCASGSEDDSDDLYFLRAFMSGKGKPVSVDRPIKVSDTPDSSERIIDAAKDRVLFEILSENGEYALVLLNFEDSRISSSGSGRYSSFVHMLDAWQRFGHLKLPWRVELVRESKPKRISGSILDDRVVGQVDGQDFVYDMRTGQLTPSDAFTVIQGVTGDEERWQTLHDVMSSSRVLGEGRLNKFEDMVAAIKSTFSGQDEAKRSRLFLPPKLPRSAFDFGVDWPPRLPFGESDAVSWAPSEFCDDPDCPILTLKTANKVAMQGVSIFGIDARRLGLQYVPGRKYPTSSTGFVGHKPHKSSINDNTLFYLPMTQPTSAQGMGRIASNRTLVPPMIGLPSIAMNDRGQVAFGLWTGRTPLDGLSALVQVEKPLIEAGMVVQNTVFGTHGAGRFRAPETKTFRSAIGVNVDGHVLYAFGAQVTLLELAKKLSKAGAVFAVPLLDREPKRPYFGTGKKWSQGVEDKEEDETDVRSAAREYLSVYQIKRIPQKIELRSLDGQVVAEQNFETVYDAVGYEFIAGAELEARNLGRPNAVKVLAIDTLQVRAHLMPGWAEPRPSKAERLESLRLPSSPLFSLNLGIRNERSPFGMIFERKVWQQPTRGALTLVADGRGTIRFGRYGMSTVPDDVRWFTLIQGPELIRNGANLVSENYSPSFVPTVAVGLLDDIAYFLLSESGDRKSLVVAGQMLGLNNLMALGERGTADTGILTKYYVKNGALHVKSNRWAPLTKFQPKRSFDTSLIFTGRVASPQTRLFSGTLSSGGQK